MFSTNVNDVDNESCNDNDNTTGEEDYSSDEETLYNDAWDGMKMRGGKSSSRPDTPSGKVSSNLVSFQVIIILFIIRRRSRGRSSQVGGGKYPRGRRPSTNNR